MTLFICSSDPDGQQRLQGPHNNGEHGLAYGEDGESIEFQTIQNPYYEQDVKIIEKVTSSPNANDIEAVTATKNIYYDI